MAVTINPTVGGASANSFVTLTEADAHMEGRLNASAWESDATTDEQNRALVEATRYLSALNWTGHRVDSTQVLSWPRQWAPDPDNPVNAFFTTTEIPERVKRATYELALAFIKAGTTDVAALEASLDVQSESIAGAIETTYVAPHARYRGLTRYPAVLREIGPLLEGSSLTTRVLRN